jgi:hypothetical protein
MAILKKKMAGKPAMMKKSSMRKAKNGDDVKTVEKGETKTGEIKVRPRFKEILKENLDSWMSNRDSTDYQNTPAKTKAGKILRGANKVASTVARGVAAPLTVTQSTLDAGVRSGINAIKNKRDLNKIPEKKMGGMIKRADGSMSKRGLWDNIRANKGSGKKPTSAMLKQEKKIKAQTKKK